MLTITFLPSLGGGNFHVKNCLFCSCLGLFAPSSCLQHFWGGCWKQLLWLQSGNIHSRGGLCPCSLLLPRPSPRSLPGCAVSFLSPVCHPHGALASLETEAGPGTRHHRMQEPLLSSGLSPPRPFPLSQGCTKPWLQWRRQSGGGSNPGRVPLPQPGFSGPCHLLAWGQQCWATRWHN